MFHRIAAGVLGLAFAPAFAAFLAPQSGPTLTNLGVAASPGLGEVDALPGVGFLFPVPEAAQGSLDLNGDGDVRDAIPHLAPMSGTTCISMGRALGIGSAVFDQAIVFGVSEIGDGVDLNFDGDTRDNSLAAFDLTGAQLGSSGLAAPSGFFARRGSFYFFGVSESSQGVDLNGDGDTLDDVLHYVEPPNMGAVNLRLAVTSPPWPPHSETLWTFLVSENAQGADLDGDGQMSGMIPFLFDGPSHSLQLAPFFSQVFAVSGRLAVVAVKEPQAGLDLNGDGDQLDWVVHTFDADTGAIANIGLAFSGSFGSIMSSDDAIAILVDEAFQGGLDLNGDGDAHDLVTHTLHPASGVVRNSGLAYGGSLLSVSGTTALFRVGEVAQGANDLNGDGDAVDDVLHAFDAATGLTRNSGLASSDEFIGETLVAARVSESAQGSTDLNGDGDVQDDVRHMFHWSSGVTFNTGVASPFPSGAQWAAAGDDWAVFTVGELNHGAADLNGDGDVLDAVLYLYEHATQTLTNLHLAVGSPGVLVGDHFFVRVPEGSQGQVDLNGDGDSLDHVLHRLDVR